jgi:hypothetical protein
MQIGPHDAQTNFCQWVQLALPVSNTCLHGHMWAVSTVIGAVAASSFFWAIWPEQGPSEQPRPSPSSLRQMSVTTIAEYLANESRWGWGQYLLLSLRSFVRDEVPHELRRAARAGEVRFLGSVPNSNVVTEIGRPYWKNATFNKDKIWDSRTNFFSEVLSSATPIRDGSINYQHGSAPQSDVLETWPRASFLFRGYVRARLFFKRMLQGFPAYLSDNPSPATGKSGKSQIWLKPSRAALTYPPRGLRRQYALYDSPETLKKICAELERMLSAESLIAKGLRTPNPNGLVEVPIPAEEWRFLKLNVKNETAIGNGIEYTDVLIKDRN